MLLFGTMVENELTTATPSCRRTATRMADVAMNNRFAEEEVVGNIVVYY